MKRSLITAFLCLLLATLAWVGFDEGFDEGSAAHKRGDYATALSEWQPLAAQGHASAQFNLGSMYRLGHGVPKDYTGSAKWYRKAAEQGYANAQFNLGIMYSKGSGVPQDDVQAYKWFQLAAIQGVKTAEKNRDMAAKKLTPAQIAEARKIFREWAEEYNKRKGK